MKIFIWMPWKLKTDTTSSFGGLATGVQVTTSKNSKLKWQSQDCHHLKDFGADNCIDSSTREHDEIFPGFLTIGTLNMEPVTEPSTPTFGLASQETNEEVIADIKYDLKLISDDLEKFLKAEIEEKDEHQSKKSQERIITFSDEVKAEKISYNSAKKLLYPLQEFLLRSSAEQCNTREKERKEKLSLHGSFKRSKMISVDDKSNKKAVKENKSSNYLKNKMLQTPPTHTEIFAASIGCAAKPFWTVRKLSKIKSMLHKKIHPEISNAEEEDKDFSKYENGRILNKSRSASRKSNKIGCWTSLTSGKRHHSKTDVMLPPDAIAKTNLELPTKHMVGCAEREHWIKTDAEYFVLELREKEGNQSWK